LPGRNDIITTTTTTTTGGSPKLTEYFSLKVLGVERRKLYKDVLNFYVSTITVSTISRR